MPGRATGFGTVGSPLSYSGLPPRGIRNTQKLASASPAKAEAIFFSGTVGVRVDSFCWVAAPRRGASSRPGTVDPPNRPQGNRPSLTRGKSYQRQEALKQRASRKETLAEIAKSYAVDISMISRL
jgi:hypothetical protein